MQFKDNGANTSIWHFALIAIRLGAILFALFFVAELIVNLFIEPQLSPKYDQPKSFRDWVFYSLFVAFVQSLMYGPLTLIIVAAVFLVAPYKQVIAHLLYPVTKSSWHVFKRKNQPSGAD